MIKLWKTPLLREYLQQKIEIVFFISLFFFFLFFLLNQIINSLLYFQYFQIGFWRLAKIVLLSFPAMLESLFSFCSMLAAMLVALQMSKNSELLAYFSQGISSSYLYFCVIRFGLFLFLISFLILAWVRPLFFEMREELTIQTVHQGDFKFFPQKLNPIGDYFFYFQEKKGKQFHQVLIFNRENPLTRRIISAKAVEIRTSISENLFLFSLKNGKIINFPQEKQQEYQLWNFEKLEFPVVIENIIQLKNIANRIIHKDSFRFIHLTLPEIYKKTQALKKDGDLEWKESFTRMILIFTRSLHNIALPLVGFFLGFFYSRFPPRWTYLKFFVCYITYYFIVIQIENASIDALLSSWWNFLPPFFTCLLVYKLLIRKIES